MSGKLNLGKMLFCAFRRNNQDSCGDAYSFLPGESGENCHTSSREYMSPFANAGFLSTMFFCWLNALMKKGKEKTLEDEDIPVLRQEDQAGTCYYCFKRQLIEQKRRNPHNQPSILSSILFCQRNAILISGLFALVKILTLSTGPLFLYSFINIAQEKEVSRNKGFALTAGFLLAKCLESFAERQWLFRTRLIGLQVKSLLTSAIYQKQIRLSKASENAYSPGEILNYVTVDAHKIGEFPYWFHQMWTIGLQICAALVIIYFAVGPATVVALLVVVLSVIGNSPVAKLQLKYLRELMVAQDRMLKAISEALTNMKVMKLYAWEIHFRTAVERLRKEEFSWLSAIQTQKGYYLVLFWSSPVIVSAATFWACYLFKVQLNASNVFTFLATLRILQEPIRSIPDVLGIFIEAKVSLTRIVKFLEAPEMENRTKCQEVQLEQHCIMIKSYRISWNSDCFKPTLSNISLLVKPGEKVAICGEVGSGKSTLLAAILGEVPYFDGSIQVFGKTAYVSQAAWIQTGTIQENILFGSTFDQQRYKEVLTKCSLVKDLDMLPFGDQTVIGERGVNLSGGQKQRVQLARALYQDADIYLLDDPFSAVDAHTATNLFNEYVMGALLGKTVLLVTHQVDFLAAFDSVLLMSGGKILGANTYSQLLTSSQEFQELVRSHGDVLYSKKKSTCFSQKSHLISELNVETNCARQQLDTPVGQQLIKQEERETGESGLKPYIQYLSQNKGFFYLFLAILAHLAYIVGQLVQNLWLATNLQSYSISELRLISVYTIIGCLMSLSLLLRSYVVVVLGLKASKSIFHKLITSLFSAPMSFYDCTPLGRIFSRVSSDLSVIDLELSFKFSQALSATMTTYFTLGILTTLTWPILFVTIPMVYLTILLQKFYFASAKELMRIHGTTISTVASFLAESIAGGMTIRALGEEDRFFLKFLALVDKNASAYFHSISMNEWLILRLEMLCAIVLSSSALAMILLPTKTSDSGYVGMALSYALSLNIFLVYTVQNQCMLENTIVSVERLEQYMHTPGEAPGIIEDSRAPPQWPSIGEVEIRNLKVRYQLNSPLVLQGISCLFKGGDKIGIVGRTGSGKTTLVSSLFRLIEPSEGSIIIDDLNIATIGIHDLRSKLAIIPQEPVLFFGSVRYNLDPLSEHADSEIWEVLEKCQLHEVMQNKGGLDSSVLQDGSNWSMGQRQLFCLGRALLKRRKILVLDEATASVDNTTDYIIQKTIQTEFADCTVITVAHRIPTVINCCTMVLAMSDGKVVEYDKPVKLMNEEGSLFGLLVKEYWLHSVYASKHSKKC